MRGQNGRSRSQLQDLRENTEKGVDLESWGGEGGRGAGVWACMNLLNTSTSRARPGVGKLSYFRCRVRRREESWRGLHALEARQCREGEGKGNARSGSQEGKGNGRSGRAGWGRGWGGESASKLRACIGTLKYGGGAGRLMFLKGSNACPRAQTLLTPPHPPHPQS